MNPLKFAARLFTLIVCLMVSCATFADGSVSFAKGDNLSCTLLAPPNGSGATWQYELTGNKERCEDNYQDFIVFTGLPSAARILLTDSPTCSTVPSEDNGFVFVIQTTKKVSTTPERIQIHHLADYAEDKIFHPGFLMITNKRFNQAQIHSRLSCVSITVSSEKIMPNKDVVVVPDLEWSPGQQEHNSDFTCRANTFLVGRKHYGDSEGMTQYHCASIAGFKTTDPQSAYITETDSIYTCPKNKVMIGRKYLYSDPHGNDRDKTTYRCATLTNADGQIVNQVRGQWTDAVKERDSTTVCEPNQVMVGRAHTGDDEGHTRIRCATLHNTPPLP